MKLNDVIQSHSAYLKTFAKPTSQAAYRHLYFHLKKRFPDKELESFTAQEIFDFLNGCFKEWVPISQG